MELHYSAATESVSSSMEEVGGKEPPQPNLTPVNKQFDCPETSQGRCEAEITEGNVSLDRVQGRLKQNIAFWESLQPIPLVY